MEKFEIYNLKFELKSAQMYENLNFKPSNLFSNFKFQISNSWRSQVGVSSMMVLILVVLLIIVGWEIGQFAALYSDTSQAALDAAAKRAAECVGSNTTYDCYDQDEGTDFVDP